MKIFKMLVIVLLALTFSSPVWAYTLHDPIVIGNDFEFIPANGVTGGSGTQNDPYIISGWQIINTADRGVAIYIHNVSKYFVIYNCFVWGSVDGIKLISIAACRATILNVTAWLNDDGIHVEYVPNLEIDNATVTYNSLNGIYVRYSDNMSILGLTESRSIHGVKLFYSNNFDIEYSTFDNNSQTGLSSSYSAGSTVAYNTVSNNWNGVHLGYNDAVEVHHNYFTGNSGTGLTLGWLETGGSYAYMNSFIDNGYYNAFDFGEEDSANYWSKDIPCLLGGMVSRGNYWDDMPCTFAFSNCLVYECVGDYTIDGSEAKDYNPAKYEW